MKTKIFIRSLAALAAVATISACDENSWNDHLDGFKEFDDAPITDVKTVEYTLADADYQAIASNSDNVKYAKEHGLEAALAAVGTRKAFSPEAPASVFAPAFFSTTSFPYFTLNDGSAVALTYKESEPLSPEIAAAAAAQKYTVTSEDYQADVWGSDEDFIEAFAPEKQPGNFIPALLADNLDANEGEYALVTYNMASTNPVFGNVGGGDEPAFECSDVIGSVVKDDVVEVDAIVMGICAQGYIIADNSGAIFVYCGRDFDTSTVTVGDQVHISGTIGAYNRGLQVVANTSATPFSLEVVGHQNVTYPAPKVYTGAELETAITREGDALAIYAEMTGTVVVNGNNINLVLSGAEKAQGSVYQGTAAQKALFNDGDEVTMCGYFIAIAGGRYCSVVVTSVDGTPVAAAPARVKAPAAAVPAETMNALYRFDGNRWSQASEFAVLNPADYTQMGQSYPNLTEPALYLPTYLARKYPYALEGEQVNVVYTLYKSGASSTACDPYVFNGSEWTLDLGIKETTSQFVRSEGKWMYDPNVTITLPAGRGQELSSKYFQACVDWVYENICVPLGDTSIKSGKFYVTSYGNNEYYSGTSAYQGNVDLRGDKAIQQYPAGYEGMTEEQVVELMKKRFMEEVMPGALSALHPEAAPVAGIDVIYTVNFAYYTGSTTEATARFRVVAPGKFEPIDCTWDAAN